MKINNRIHVIEGPKKGRYPYSNSVLIGKSLIIDTGAGDVLKDLKVEWVINSHWHEDHIALNKIGKRVAAHVLDAEAIESYEEFRERYGIGDLVNLFINFEFGRVNRTFEDGEEFEIDGVTIEVLHTPGHSAGHCCFIIDEKAIFLADVDLTSFGPWYGCRDCHVGDFVRSIEKIMKVVQERDISIAIPSHGDVVFSEENIIGKLDGYLKVIYERDKKIRELISAGEEPVGKGVIYRRIPEPKDIFLNFEKIMVEKHLTTFQYESSPP
ncbi:MULTISPECIES: MBL fold metallo-hydrolase [unclassified Archaeoglobus]|jgi:glyoxylase-like metal-dependent hydrolase (beta-lactamase superfamily II)|uniref:MBL fold metallo-hydrolase n=1 Tax=unclassified Archaeoglobus TaxID=2643606 RepID=UPI0025B7D72A|nr:MULTISPECIES: MBL fold metallo-hydrolase [unclassified Archaeoglobus]